MGACCLVVVQGDVVLESLDLDGTLWIEAPEGTTVTVRKLVVKNKGWAFEPVAANDPDEVGHWHACTSACANATPQGQEWPPHPALCHCVQVLRMRGYKLVKGEEAKVVAPAKAGALVLMPDLKLLPPSQVGRTPPPPPLPSSSEGLSYSEGLRVSGRLI